MSVTLGFVAQPQLKTVSCSILCICVSVASWVHKFQQAAGVTDSGVDYVSTAVTH